MHRACSNSSRKPKAQGVKAKPVLVGPVTYLCHRQGQGRLRPPRAVAAPAAGLCRAARRLRGAGRRMGADRRAAARDRARCRLAATPSTRLPPPQEREDQDPAGHLLRPARREQVPGAPTCRWPASTSMPSTRRDDVLPLSSMLPPHMRAVARRDQRPQHLEDRPWPPCSTGSSRWPERPGRPPLDRALVLVAACAASTWTSEQKLDAELKSWLAFALQKLEELRAVPAHCATAARPWYARRWLRTRRRWPRAVPRRA